MSALALTVLASAEAKKSGPIGLAVILILCVACYFLFKSMSKHMRKVREEFPVGQQAPATDETVDEQAPTAEAPEPVPHPAEPPPGGTEP